MKGFKYMLGVTVEPKLVKELDELRGEVPRSRVVEKALNQYVQAWKMAAAAESKNLEGLKGSTPTAQPAPTPTPPTATSYASSLMKTANDEGQEVIER